MKKFRLVLVLILLLVCAVAVVWYIKQPAVESDMYHPPARTKTSGCVVKMGLPDPACTPGAVNFALTREQVCSMHATDERHTHSAVIRETFVAYGVSRDDGVEREDDHLIPLWLGGADNEIANHWPQIYEDWSALKAGTLPESKLGAHAKDRLERWLHIWVCKDGNSLKEAQRMIATDWKAAYRELMPLYFHKRRR